MPGGARAAGEGLHERVRFRFQAVMVDIENVLRRLDQKRAGCEESVMLSNTESVP